MEFPKNKLVFSIGGVLGGLLLLAMAIVWDLNVWLVVLLLVLWFVLLGGAITVRGIKKQERLPLFIQQCRPDIAVLEYERLLTKQRGWPLQMNYAVALISMGHWQQAVAVLEGVQQVMKGKNWVQGETLLNVHLFYCHFATGDVQAAGACLARAVQIAEEKNLPKDKFDLLATQHMLAMMQGHYTDARRYFEENKENTGTLLGKVSNRYLFGSACAALGDMPAAREAFAFAAQNGGTTWYATTAQIWLQQNPPAAQSPGAGLPGL